MAGTDATALLRLQRPNYVVADIERSLKLYRDVLGFEVAFSQGHNPDSYSFAIFDIPSDAKIGFCVLSTRDQPRVMALTEIGGVALPARLGPRRAAIVLDVASVDTVMAGARALGLEVFDEFKLITNDGREGREVGIVDFDDNLVMIYNIPEAGQ